MSPGCADHKPGNNPPRCHELHPHGQVSPCSDTCDAVTFKDARNFHSRAPEHLEERETELEASSHISSNSQASHWSQQLGHGRVRLPGTSRNSLCPLHSGHVGASDHVREGDEILTFSEDTRTGLAAWMPRDAQCRTQEAMSPPSSNGAK